MDSFQQLSKKTVGSSGAKWDQGGSQRDQNTIEKQQPMRGQYILIWLQWLVLHTTQSMCLKLYLNFPFPAVCDWKKQALITSIKYNKRKKVEKGKELIFDLNDGMYKELLHVVYQWGVMTIVSLTLFVTVKD